MAFLSGSCLTHDFAAFDSLLLALRDTGTPVGRKIITRQWRLVVHMRIKRQQECWPLPYNPHASVTMARDAALVPFGPLAPTREVQMVRGKIRRLATHKHPRLTAAHHLGTMLIDGIRARLPRLLQREALCLTLLRCHRIARPQRGIDRLQVLGISANVLQGITGDIQPTVNPASKTGQQRRCSPPFWACR